MPTVPQAFDDFMRGLELTEPEKKGASRQHNDLRGRSASTSAVSCTTSSWARTPAGPRSGRSTTSISSSSSIRRSTFGVWRPFPAKTEEAPDATLGPTRTSRADARRRPDEPRTAAGRGAATHLARGRGVGAGAPLACHRVWPRPRGARAVLSRALRILRLHVRAARVRGPRVRRGVPAGSVVRAVGERAALALGPRAPRAVGRRGRLPPVVRAPARAARHQPPGRAKLAFGSCRPGDPDGNQPTFAQDRGASP
jgi:hypothetical protein